MATHVFDSFDASGNIRVSVFRENTTTPASIHIDHECEVPSESVVIGGGSANNAGAGALLFASYPRGDLGAWLVSSKDHLVSSPHLLSCYALGMQVKGMTREQLVSAIQVTDATGLSAAHPMASAQAPLSSHFLIGGGFRVNMRPTDPGNLATASYPEFDQEWSVKAKDHGVPSEATITSFAVAITKQLTTASSGTLDLEVGVSSGFAGPSDHPLAEAILPFGFALTGIGAEVRYSEPGQMLMLLRPQKNGSTPEGHGVSAASKDHAGYPSHDIIKVWALGIRAL
ncbi:hypothetical protein [Streptomyces sp. SID12488]|uniref:hypothetical protein n=1 Tax=Streptomyces sp. SID12488 TaxID=2706040 RepID=UPI0013D9F21F|nr:hypothetical protein [Streptomyces sp. SID12488]NEA65379.1 hypothetical protein [Streptomyces sp. SID12488]